MSWETILCTQSILKVDTVLGYAFIFITILSRMLKHLNLVFFEINYTGLTILLTVNYLPPKTPLAHLMSFFSFYASTRSLSL